MSGSATGEWTIFYRRLDEPTVWKTMRYKRSDGVLVSAKTYDEVYKFNRFKEAFEFAKELITEEISLLLGEVALILPQLH